MRTDVDSYIKQCTICQQAKDSNTHPARLLQPLPIPSGVWKDISMDFIEGLPKSEGYSVIMVIVDRLTEYAHCIPVKHPYTATSIAKLFLDNITKLYGMPQSIVSDRDTIFVSSSWKELFKLYKVTLNLSTAYHPQTYGQTERVNQCLEMYLRCSIQDSPTTWKSWLSLAQLWYNSSYHSSIGCSPFMALYGYDPDLGAVPSDATDASPSVSQIIQHRKLHMQSFKPKLQQAQNRIKMFADRNRTDLWATQSCCVCKPTHSLRWPIDHFPSYLTSFSVHTRF